MFPIPWNRAYRKRNGALSTIQNMIDGASYTLPTASSEVKGGVKIGNGLTMTGEVLSANPYSLPTASSEVKGGVKIGAGLTITEDVLSVDAQVPAHTTSEAGKVLKVADDGSLEWDDAGSGGGVLYDGTGSTLFPESRKITIPDNSVIYVFSLNGEASTFNLIPDVKLDGNSLTGTEIEYIGYNTDPDNARNNRLTKFDIATGGDYNLTITQGSANNHTSFYYIIVSNFNYVFSKILSKVGDGALSGSNNSNGVVIRGGFCDADGGMVVFEDYVANTQVRAKTPVRNSYGSTFLIFFAEPA